MFADAHCHLTFFKNLKQVIEKAKEKKVEVFVSCPANFKAENKFAFFEENLALNKQFPEILPLLGIHPNDLLKMNSITIEECFKFVENNLKKCFGIGEVGLDFKYAKKDDERKKMEKVFKRFIQIAKENNLGLNVHLRFAERKTLEVLQEEKAELVLMHWFLNSEKMCKMAVDSGYFISVGPMVFSNKKTQEVVEKIELENLLLETDAPVKFDNLEAEPKWIPKVAEKLAELKETDVKEIASVTTRNTRQLFKQKI